MKRKILFVDMPGRAWAAVSEFKIYESAVRAEVRCSFITTTVREESQVTPQGRHR